MFGVYSHLTNRLIMEVLGPTKNDRDLATKAILSHEKLAKLNQEMRDYEEEREEEAAFDAWYIPDDLFFADDEFFQRSQDKRFLEVGRPIVELDVPKLPAKQRKRGLGKKGRFLAERRYVASRANKLSIAYNSSMKNGTSADAKWMAARLRRSTDMVHELNASFAELARKMYEEKTGINPWKIQFVPSEEPFYREKDGTIVYATKEEDEATAWWYDDDPEEWRPTRQEDVHDHDEEEEDLEPRCMRSCGEY